MYAFPYQPEVVQKKFYTALLSFYWEMQKNKSEVRVPHRYLILPPVPPPLFSSKISMKKEKMNLSIHWTLVRDWRGSNPQLPPWQGGALTNWTTIPARCIAYIYLGFHKNILLVMLERNRYANAILILYPHKHGL